MVWAIYNKSRLSTFLANLVPEEKVSPWNPFESISA
jgi:hypothetical protein